MDNLQPKSNSNPNPKIPTFAGQKLISEMWKLPHELESEPAPRVL